jgi:hypothetical protein
MISEPKVARWLSRDPYRDAESRLGPNLYDYVHNDPINWLDPFGLKDYTKGQTLAIIYNSTAELDNFYDPISAAVYLVWTHGGFGSAKYDYNFNGHSGDTFCVDGQRIDADKFGNYLAGYDGAYAFGTLGAGAVSAAGYYYATGDGIANSIEGNGQGFNYDQSYISEGVNDSANYMQQNPYHP